MEGMVAVVRGRRIEAVDVELIRKQAAMFADVVIDLGTGDARWLYRHARAHPDRFWLGIDASAHGARKVTRRALRPPERGGAHNLVVVRAGLDALPGGLAALAGEVHVQYPWGGLLRAVLRPEGAGLHRLPGSQDMAGLRSGLGTAYAAAGLDLRRCEVAAVWPESTWAGRLGQGRPLPVVWVEAEKR